MKKLLIGLLFIGFTSQIYGQVIKLEEVVIEATNYKYLDAVTSQETPVSVQELQRKVANFNLKASEFYMDEYDFYNVSFFIPDGKILVAYDRNGKVLRTVEKFKNIKLPKAVRTAIDEKYPGWTYKKDVYRVTYNDGSSQKLYKVVLEKNNATARVKLDEEGNFQ